jgi:hypothetical protein
VIAPALLLAFIAGAADGGSSFQPPEVTALAHTLDAGAAPLDLAAASPADPFSREYLPPVAQEVGAGAGQLRLFALGGLTHAPELVGELAAESMHLSFLALRGSLTAELSHFGVTQPHFLTARVGVALHVAPYHRVDFSLFLDAGLAVADLFTAQRRASPVLSPGLALEVALTTHLFLRAEGQLFWAVLPLTGSSLRGAGLLGLGWTL